MPQKGRNVPPAGPRPSERRIQACLQACEGLSTEGLEAGNLVIVFDSLTQMHTALRILEHYSGEACSTPDALGPWN